MGDELPPGLKSAAVAPAAAPAAAGEAPTSEPPLALLSTLSEMDFWMGVPHAPGLNECTIRPPPTLDGVARGAAAATVATGGACGCCGCCGLGGCCGCCGWGADAEGAAYGG